MLITGSPLVTVGNIFESKLVKLKNSTTINLENYILSTQMEAHKQ